MTVPVGEMAFFDAAELIAYSDAVNDPPQPQRVFLLQPLTDSLVEYKAIVPLFVATHNKFFFAEINSFRSTFMQDACKN
jgi:hypothetical protein